MLIDAEAHLIQPQRRTLASLAGYDEPAMRGKVFNHPEGELALARADAAALRDSLAACGIDRAVIMGLPWQSSALCRENNEYIAAACSAAGNTFSGFGVLNPADGAAADEELDRCADEYGFHGVKVIAAWQGWSLDDACAERLAAACVERNLVLLPHIAYLHEGSTQESPAHLLRLARRHPRLKILAPHLGGLLCMHELHAPLREQLRNVRYITSVPTTMGMVAAAAQCCAEDKLAFGTDYPFQPSHDQRTVLDAFNALALPAALRARIAAANLLEFIGMA